MAKVENRSMIKGWNNMSGPYMGMGKPRKMVGGRTMKIPGKFNLGGKPSGKMSSVVRIAKSA